MTDTMGRMHSDAQFAGMILGIGNNPMVGCTVACAVDVATALNKYEIAGQAGNDDMAKPAMTSCPT